MVESKNIGINVMKEKRSFITLRDTLFIIALIFFINPIYYNGMSVNYSFLLLPVLFGLNSGVLVRPSSLVLFFFISVILVFLFSLLSLHEFQYSLRRIFSFIIVLSLATFVLIRLNMRVIRNFAYALAILSAMLTLPLIYKYVSLGEIQSITKLKGFLGFGNQRTVSIHLMAFFLLLYDILYNKRSIFFKNILFFLLFLSFCGIAFSFSRAAFVAFAGTLMLIFIKNFKLKKFLSYKFCFYIIVLSLIFYYINNHLIFRGFIEGRFIEPLFSGEILFHFLNQTSSEGIRAMIWMDIFEYIINNPLIGSGFLGYWIISPDLSGSCHSDYLDRLLRFGIPLFSLYMFLLLKILNFLKRNFSHFYYGYISLLIFGFFHEAFAISSGAVILSFLIGLYSQRNSLEKSNL